VQTAAVKSTELALATEPIGALSTSNQISGTIRAVDRGSVMTTVKVEIGGGDTLTAAITRSRRTHSSSPRGSP
jgi:molybdate transport system regulatory protein